MSAAPVHVLMCTRGVPDAERQSGSRRLFNLAELLREAGCEVTLVSAHRGRDVDRRRFHRLGIPTFGYAELPDLLEATRFDAALIAFWLTAEEHAPLIRERSPQTRIVIDSIDLHFVRRAREAATASEAAHAISDEELEREYARELHAYTTADAVLTVSEKEAVQVRELTGDSVPVFHVPDCEDVRTFADCRQPLATRRGIVFLANFQHPPNRDAGEFLCRDIAPRIPEEVLAAHPIAVVGNALDSDLLETCRETRHVTAVGWVPSVAPYLASARVSVAPLRYGAGTKRKMIQSLIVGTPTVGTAVAVEGIGVEHGQGVLVADDPAEFAQAVTTLATEDGAWQRTVDARPDDVVSGYDRGATAERLLGCISAVVGREPRQAGMNGHAAAPTTHPSTTETEPGMDVQQSAPAGPRAPVFIVGSPRSGTSILTWALGQHSNILPLEESDWISKFGINAATSHALGSARGERSQLSSMGISRDAFMSTFGDAAFDLIAEHRLAYARLVNERGEPGKGPNTAFQIMRSPDDQKRRWVDGTPEYSHHIVALRALFPQARFIHLLRDAQDAAVSMVKFHTVGGPRWTWDQSYRKWLNHVRACVAAERAYGSEVVLRLPYSDLAGDPESAIRTCLGFLGEPYEAACLEPLETKINSSNVEDAERILRDRDVDPKLEREALELSEKLAAQGSRALPPSEERAAALERDYYSRVPQLEVAYARHAGPLTPAEPSTRADEPEQPAPPAAAEPGAGPNGDEAGVMKRDWNARAKQNAMYYIASGREDWTEQEFFESGRRNVNQLIVKDFGRITQGMDPKQMRALEIGCGIGRMTRHLATEFGEVHGVDVAGEMIETGREKLADVPNAHLHETSGKDLSMFEDGYFDFAFSFIVFQHIPYREAILSYIEEVHRTLKPGRMFKFQVQGGKVDDPNTWLGVGFTEQELAKVAAEVGYTPLAASGQGTQYFWNWWLRD